ncbi:MAG: DUF1569 domain-containing protein [Bacteroidia bacterium]|nr:DUF1569 domain-containing protein [Bacteroidia bacterium]
MQSIFDEQTRQELYVRISRLQATDKAQWGKMNAWQMLRHCTLSEEMFLGMKSYKRLFAGRIFGGMALKSILKNEAPLKKNQPTHPELKINGNGDLEAEKQKWLTLLEKYADYNNPYFVHPFFGSMDAQQVGIYVYKHTDHHLRQFRK